MNFELSSKQSAAHARARTLAAERLVPVAVAIDDSSAIAPDVLRELRALVAESQTDGVALVSVVEELATISAAAAAAAAIATDGVDAAAPGLRGFHAAGAGDTRGRLVMAAVALGIGRAALAAALDTLRDSARQSQDQEKPHWAVADAATEIAAARALTLQAAQTMADEAAAAGFVAMAKLAAARAAQLAVDVALRVTGPQGFTRGALLERLARDARTVALIFGTEEDLRATAANAVLPG